MEIIFHDNGNTSVFEDNEQVPRLQKSWLLVFADFLKANGVDPTEVEITLSSGKKATIFDTSDNYYSWRIT